MADSSLIHIQPMVRYFPKIGVWKKYIANLELVGKWQRNVNIADFPRLYSVKILHGSRLNLDKFANVPFLNFYHNPVISIAPLTGVRHLKLHTASVTEIPPLPNLEILELIECRGVKFTEAASPLMVLGMDKCGVKDISFVEKFKGTLRELNLPNNDIIDISPLKNIKLRALNLSNNGYSIYNQLDVETIRNIKYLDISNTTIYTLPRLVKLKYLNCEYTTISSLTPNDAPNLETLLMSWSKITNVAAFEKLETISMRENNQPCAFRDLPALRYLEIGSYIGRLENLPKLQIVRIPGHVMCDLTPFTSIETILVVHKPYETASLATIAPPGATIIEVAD